METKTRGFVFGILTGLSREKRVLLTGHSDQFSFEESPISATEMNITTMLNVSSTTSVGDANLEELAFWIYYFTMLFFVSIFTIVGNLLVIQAMVKNEWVSSRQVLGHYPLNTWCNNNVAITSKRRHFDVITSKWRRFDLMTTSLLRNVSAGYGRYLTLLFSDYT